MHTSIAFSHTPTTFYDHVRIYHSAVIRSFLLSYLVIQYTGVEISPAGGASGLSTQSGAAGGGECGINPQHLGKRCVFVV